MPYKQRGRGTRPSASAKPEYMILTQRNILDNRKFFNSPHSLEYQHKRNSKIVVQLTQKVTAERPRRVWLTIQKHINQHTALQKHAEHFPLPTPNTEIAPHKMLFNPQRSGE